MPWCYWSPSLRLEEDQFFDFCQANNELRIERNAEGDCEIITPTGGKTSTRNSRIVTLLSIWAEADGTGVVFDSSGGYTLPNGAVRSPNDNINVLQDKMQEYIVNRASLGWLIDPETKRVYVFQPNKPISNLGNPVFLSADKMMKGF